MTAIKMTVPPRQFLGFCETPESYARAAAEGHEIFGFTGGEFSLIDIISACVDAAQKPNLVISTWTAAKAEMDHVFRFLESGKIRHAQWIVDRSFPNRQPELCQALRDIFGDGCIRVQRVHCKFALIGDKDSGLILQTSANLNRNPRIENVSVSPCPVFYFAYQQLVNDTFEIQAPGEGFDDTSSPTRTYKQLTLGSETPIERKIRLKKKRLQKRMERLQIDSG